MMTTVMMTTTMKTAITGVGCACSQWWKSIERSVDDNDNDDDDDNGDDDGDGGFDEEDEDVWYWQIMLEWIISHCPSPINIHEPYKKNEFKSNIG